MSSTTHRGGSPVTRTRPAPLRRQERIEGLLAETKRRIVPIRTRFVQIGRGAETKPGPVQQFLKAHDERGLDAYLFVHAMASASFPWDCTMVSDVWVSALGLDENATPASAKTAVAKIMRRLEARKLVIRVRSQRLSAVRLLIEDGSGAPYELRSAERAEDRWLQLPHAYWLEGHYKTLSLPAKVMLLIALSLADRFQMPYHWGPKYYGISFDSTEQGLRELRKVGLLTTDHDWVKAPRSSTGWTERLLYTLQGSFSAAERKKASKIRNRTAGEGDAEVEGGNGLLAPVVPLAQPTLADFYAQPSADEFFLADGQA